MVRRQGVKENTRNIFFDTQCNVLGNEISMNNMKKRRAIDTVSFKERACAACGHRCVACGNDVPLEDVPLYAITNDLSRHAVQYLKSSAVEAKVKADTTLAKANFDLAVANASEQANMSVATSAAVERETAKRALQVESLRALSLAADLDATLATLADVQTRARSNHEAELAAIRDSAKIEAEKATEATIVSLQIALAAKHDALAFEQMRWQNEYTLRSKETASHEREKQDLIMQQVKLKNNSSDKGKKAETEFYPILAAVLGMSASITLKTKDPHSGDYWTTHSTTRTKLTGLWENKNYVQSVPKEQVDKFWNDMRLNPHVDYGVMVSMNSNIDAHNTRPVVVERFEDGRCLFYVNKFFGAGGPSGGVSGDGSAEWLMDKLLNLFEIIGLEKEAREIAGIHLDSIEPGCYHKKIGQYFVDMEVSLKKEKVTVIKELDAKLAANQSAKNAFYSLTKRF